MADYTMDRPIPDDRSQFRVAVVCALSEEFSAIAATLDIDFKRDCNRDFRQPETDKNTYKTGRIGVHDVVIVQLPRTGKEPAATAASSILGTYSKIELALVVGVCAGAPKDQKGEDIILGDVLISTHVFQPDHARMFDTGMQPYQEVEDTLGRASKSIKGFLTVYSSDYEKTYIEDLVSKSVKTLLQKTFLQKYAYPGREKDKLFRPEYQHQHKVTKCEECQKDPAECQEARTTLCTELGCENTFLRDRKRLEPPTNIQPSGRQPLPPHPPLSSPLSPSPPPSPPQSPLSPPPPPLRLHFGRFASADQLIRSSSHRDKLIRQYNVIGFEMEGAGVWDTIPTVVIKGVCDYADSHKNKDFQGYAAVTAAACAKVLLHNWHLVDEPQVKESLATDTFKTKLEGSRIAQEGTDKLIEQLQQKGKKPARKQTETETKTEEWETGEEIAKIAEEAAANAKVEEEKQKKIEEGIMLKESIRLDWISVKMTRLEDEMRVLREANETEKAQRAAWERPLSPPTEALSPSQNPIPSWQPLKSDPEVDIIRKQPELFKTKQAKKERKEKQELEDGIKREAEDNLQRRMEEMRRAQEEANKEIEKAKAELERAIRERIEAEKRAEEERQKFHDEAIKRAEREVRGKVELEANIRKEDSYHERLEEMRRAQPEVERAAMERAAMESPLPPPEIFMRVLLTWLLHLMSLIIDWTKSAREKRQRPDDEAIKQAERDAEGKIVAERKVAERKAKTKPIVKSRL